MAQHMLHGAELIEENDETNLVVMATLPDDVRQFIRSRVAETVLYRICITRGESWQ